MASTALDWALNNGMTQAQFDQRIFDAVLDAQQKGTSNAMLRIEMDRLGISSEDVARATGVTPESVQEKYTAALPKTRAELIANAAADKELAERAAKDTTATKFFKSSRDLDAITSAGLLTSDTERTAAAKATADLAASQKAAIDKLAADNTAAAAAATKLAADKAAAKIASDKAAAAAAAATAASKIAADKAAADAAAIAASNASSVDKAAAVVAAKLAADKAAADKIASDKAAAAAVTAKAAADKTAADNIIADKAAAAARAATEAGLAASAAKTASDKAAADAAAIAASNATAAQKDAAAKTAADAKIASDAAAARVGTDAAAKVASDAAAAKAAAARTATTTGTRSPAYAYALANGMTEQQYYKNIFDFYSKNSGLSDSMLRSEMDRLQISPQDVAAATGVTVESVLTRYNAAKATTPAEIAAQQKAQADLAARQGQWAEQQKANETAWAAQQAKNAADWAAQQKLTQNAQNAYANAPLTLGQKFGSYESIPIGAQYNPAVTPGGVSPYSMVMGQMTPFQNPYANFVPGTALGGYNPNLYNQIAANNAAAAKAAAETKAAADTKATNDALMMNASAGGADSAAAADAAAAAAAAPGVAGSTAATAAADNSGNTSGASDGTDGSGNTGGGPGMGAEGDAAFAKGGMVRSLLGPDPEGPDDGLGYLDKGEYVIKRSAVNKYGRGLLDMINEGKVPAKKIRSLLY